MYTVHIPSFFGMIKLTNQTSVKRFYFISNPFGRVCSIVLTKVSTSSGSN